MNTRFLLHSSFGPRRQIPGMIKRLYDVVVVLPLPPIYLQRDVSRLFVLLRSFPQIRLNSSKNTENRKNLLK